MTCKIETKIGNLLDVKEGFIVHGCNALGVMGSGVALEVKKRYPKVYEQYKNAKLRVGTNVICGVTTDLYICNSITQEHYGLAKKRYVSYDAIETCFKDLNHQIEMLSRVYAIPNQVHIPFIGAGLGGGNWKIISTIIEETCNYPVTLWKLDK